MSEVKNNSNIELIRGDPKKAIRTLAVPMMISMFLIMAYNLADSIWIAGLGADALAALGFITPFFMIIIGLGNGIGAGANSLIARSIGARDKQKANNAAIHSLIISIIISIIIPILILPFLKDILIFIGGGSSVKYGVIYGNIVFGLMIVFIFSGVASAVLRSEGDVKRATYAMAVTAILNIVLDPIFIYTFNMGIGGAGWATVLSAFISCILMAYWMWVKKDTYVDLTISKFKYKKSILKDILKVAIPSTTEQLIMSILAMTINTMLVLVATINAVAVYTAGMRVLQMAIIPLIGLGTALLTIGGASYGARNYKKLNESFNYSVKLGFIISIAIGIIMFIFAPQIAKIFSYSAVSSYLAPQIAQLLRILCFFMISIPLGLMSSSLFQGVGKGFTSLMLTICRSLIFELIFAYIIGFVLNFREIGIYIGIAIGGFVGSFIAFIWAKIFINKTKVIFS